MPRTNGSALRRARQPSVRTASFVAASLAGAALATLTPAAGADVTFQPPASYAAAAGTHDVVVGDFDRDGRPDLVTANATDDSFSFLRGKGDGTFHAATTSALGATPSSISTADFDADGNPDLVFAIQDENRVFVLWGDGSALPFSIAMSNEVATSSAASDAVGADLNADGRADLVTAHPSATVVSTFVTSSSNRGFGTGNTTVVGNGPAALAAGPALTPVDVLVMFPTTSSMGITNANGVGGLTFFGTYGLGTVTPDDVNRGAPADIALGDINGDGHLDVVTPNAGTNSATFVPNQGNGLFVGQKNTVLPAGSTPSGIAVGDFTGDGLADAAVIGRGTDAVTVMQSDGLRAPMRTVATYPAGSGLTRAAATDFNGDGAADVAIASDSGTGFVRVLLSQGHPTLAGQASESVVVGGNLSDTATLAGATPNAGGTVTFKLYGPGDTTCATALATQTENVSGNGSYASPTPVGALHAGVYRWVASYSGDATNDAVTGTCSDANQTTVVAKATPTVSVSATSSVAAGTSITPSLTLGGGHGPTGSLTLRAYATSDCSGSPLFTSSAVSVTGTGTYPSPSAFTPTTAGTVRWVASYGGDPNNQSVTSTCGASETTVTKVAPQLALSVPTPIVFESYAVPPTATLTGGYAPGGTVTFTAYTDATCTDTPAYVSNPVTVSGNGGYSPPANQFVPNAAGTYRWVARYSGDGGNDPAESVCGAAGSVTEVAPVTPAIAGSATSAMLGEPVQATATLSATTDDAGGTITLTAYADAACAGPAAFVGDPVAVDGSGEYASEQFVPDAAGDYRWIARYSGDGDNAPAATVCGAAGLTSMVAPRPVVPQPPVVEQPPLVELPPVLVPDPPVVTITKVAAPRCLAPTSRRAARGTIRYSVSASSRVTFTVQRRTNSPWPVRSTCPKPLSGRGGDTAGKYVTVRGPGSLTGGKASKRPLRRTVSVRRGTHRIALRTLVGTTKLTPGRYRVLIQARSSAGATTRRVAYLWVLKPGTAPSTVSAARGT